MLKQNTILPASMGIINYDVCMCAVLFLPRYVHLIKIKEGTKKPVQSRKKGNLEMAAVILAFYEISLKTYIFRLSGSVLADSSSCILFTTKLS